MRVFVGVNNVQGVCASATVDRSGVWVCGLCAVYCVYLYSQKLVLGVILENHCPR